jgi:hypothetical protein
MHRNRCCANMPDAARSKAGRCPLRQQLTLNILHSMGELTVLVRENSELLAIFTLNHPTFRLSGCKQPLQHRQNLSTVRSSRVVRHLSLLIIWIFTLAEQIILLYELFRCLNLLFRQVITINYSAYSINKVIRIYKWL